MVALKRRLVAFLPLEREGDHSLRVALIRASGVWGERMPFIAAAILYLIGTALVWSILRETLTQGLFVWPANAKWGVKQTAFYSLLFSIPSHLVIGFASSTWHMVPGIVIGAVTGLTFPSIQGLMTARISEDAQGELQGAIASIVGVTSIIGPPMMTGVFGAFADDQGLYFPGAPYMLSTAMIVIAAIILHRTLRLSDTA